MQLEYDQAHRLNKEIGAITHLELAIFKIEANDMKPAFLNTQKMREFGQDNVWSISSSEPRSEVQVEL